MTCCRFVQISETQSSEDMHTIAPCTSANAPVMLRGSSDHHCALYRGSLPSLHPAQRKQTGLARLASERHPWRRIRRRRTLRCRLIAARRSTRLQVRGGSGHGAGRARPSPCRDDGPRRIRPAARRWPVERSGESVGGSGSARPHVYGDAYETTRPKTLEARHGRPDPECHEPQIAHSHRDPRRARDCDECDSPPFVAAEAVNSHAGPTTLQPDGDAEFEESVPQPEADLADCDRPAT